MNAQKKKCGPKPGHIAWNKGLTKEDPRVAKYALSKGSKSTQFKPGKRPETCRENHSQWKGGIRIHKGTGYVYIRMPEHPFAKSGYIQAHRFIIERELGRFLLPKEIVHHKDGNKLNNSIENLQLVTPKEHSIIHNHKRWHK